MALTDDIAGAGAMPWWQQAWPDGPPGMGPVPPPVTDELAGAPPAPPPVDAAPPLPFAGPPGPEDQPLSIPPPPVDAAPPLPYGAEPVAQPPPPAPAPDAIAGGIAPGTPHDVALDQAQPALPEEYETSRELAADYMRDPYKAAAAQYDLDNRRQDFVAQQQAKIDLEDAKQQTASYFNYQQAMARSQAAREKLNADSDAIANTRLDRGRWFNNLDTIGRAGTWLAALSGGLVAGTTGGNGHNQAMDWIDKQVSADVDAQQADLRNRGTELTRKQGLINDQSAADADLYHQAEVMRLAGYKRALASLQTQQQQFDPRTTRSLGIAQVMNGVAGRIQQVQDAYQKADLDNQIKQGEYNIKVGELGVKQGELDLKKRELALKQAGGGKDVLQPRELQALYKSQGIDIPLPPKPMTLADHVKLMEAVGKGREAQSSEASTTVQGPDGHPLTDDKGAVIRLPAEETAKINDNITQTQDFVNVLGEARRMLANDPSSIDRQTWASITTKFEKAKMNFIKSMGANPSSREMQAVEELFGPNFENYKDRLLNKRTGLRRIDDMIDSAKDDVTIALRQKARYRGAPVITDTSRPPGHVETLDERELNTLLSSPTGGVGAGLDVSQLAQTASRGGLTDDQQLLLNDLARQLGNTEPAGRAHAFDQLNKALMNSETPAVRSEAAKILSSHGYRPKGPQIGPPGDQ